MGRLAVKVYTYFKFDIVIQKVPTMPSLNKISYFRQFCYSPFLELINYYLTIY